MSVFGVFLVRVFPHSDQKNSEYGIFYAVTRAESGNNFITIVIVNVRKMFSKSVKKTCVKLVIHTGKKSIF